jgi:tRNA-2-methylthio-N6-dimethylallyladenosine synthase
MTDVIDEAEKSRRLTIVQETQRAIQIRRNAELIGLTEEVMVEGFNKATLQWIGRTTQHRTLNFTTVEDATLEIGSYQSVMVTRSGPNSLVGELV